MMFYVKSGTLFVFNLMRLAFISYKDNLNTPELAGKNHNASFINGHLTRNTALIR